MCVSVHVCVCIVKGYVAAYKDLNLATVTIKRYFSREHSERMQLYMHACVSV